MFLRTSRQRLKNGTVLEHCQLVESVWERAKKRARTHVVYNFGRVDDPAVAERLRKLAKSILRRCAPEEIAAEAPDWRVVDAWPYGELYVVEALWKRLGLPAIIDRQAQGRRFGFALERAVFAMVANRIAAPSSKLYCYEQWLREEVKIEGSQALELQHLYRAMDFLAAHKAAIEEALYFSLADLLHLDVDLIFYDTTSLHFEVDEEDQGSEATEAAQDAGSGEAGSEPVLRKRGHSKNGRGDAPQIVVGLAVTRDGLPVRHWIFPGNTVDVTTVKQVKEDLRGWRLSRCVFVGDAGMVSAENLRTLSLGGGKYIVCMPVSPGTEVGRAVINRPGRYRQVAEHLRVKGVIVGDGERRRRYVVCHNPAEETRQRKHRARLLSELEAELATLGDADGGAETKRAVSLLASRRYGRYLRRTKTGKLRIDRTAVRAAEKHDGKFVVHSNDDTLTAEDLALGYKQLLRVEQAWRQLKSGLRMRPVFHFTPQRIQAHVFLTVLALLIERVAEQACGDTWRNIAGDLRQIKLAQLSGPNGTVWQVTEPRPEARNRLNALAIENPPAVIDHA